MSSYDVLAAAASQISEFRPFRKASKSLKEALAFDITLVALSIRTGYLVDTIYIAEHLAEGTFSALLKKLCETSDCFNEVLHLYEPFANQSFIVNKLLLIDKLELLLGHHAPNPYPTFLYLHERGEISQLDTIPQAVLEVLELLLNKLKHRHTTDSNVSAEERTVQLPRGLVSAISIPLAAIFLDYPVAYVPSSDNQALFLSNVSLMLYQCQINIQSRKMKGVPDQRDRHTLLQFSCPASLADEFSSSISVQQISNHLKSTFGPRIATSFPSSTLQVDYKRVTLDRVAL